MKILFKYPSRGRPERFFDGMNSIYNNLYNQVDFSILVTADWNDPLMNNDATIAKIKEYKNAEVIFGDSISKVDAVNRDMDKSGEWDIIVVMSDDMRFTFYGFDEIIRLQFADGDFDKLLHIPDNDAKDILATMYIAGRIFYERFYYVYPKMYKSLWCDNHIQAVAKKLNKYYFVNVTGIIFHACPAYGHLPKDEMFLKQQADWNEDEATFRLAEINNFYL